MKTVLILKACPIPYPPLDNNGVGRSTMSLGFSRFDSLQRLLTGTVTFAVIVTSQATAIAKTAREIAQIAIPITVQINNNVLGGGSGVIVARAGNTYTVLTANHVVKRPDLTYTIHTYNGKDYPVTQVQQLQHGDDADLALVTFESQDEYPIATLGNSDRAAIGVDVYVSGYPALEGQSGAARDYEFSPGIVTSRLTNRPQGYTLRYNAVTVRGMSGGPVFDASGRVIGIHGQGESEGSVVSESGAIAIKTGFNSAIPINTFLALKSHEPIGSQVKVNNTPASDRQERVSITHPTNARDYYARGLSHLDSDNRQEALSDFNQAVQLNPNDANAYNKRGTTRLALGDNQGALDDFNSAIRLNPNNADAYYQRGVIRFNQGDRHGALEDFNQYISRSPNDIQAYYNRGVIRRDLRDYQGAFEDFDSVVRLDPDDPAAYYNRGLARSMLRDRQGTLKDFDQALSLDPTWLVVYNNRAILRNRLGDREGAIEDFSQVLRLDPKDGIAYFNRGLVHLELGDRQGAIQDLQSAADLFQQKGDANNYQKAMEKIHSIQP